eukprot:m.60779 g.60779  ORF g.60779 m.60779 type:complete len:53 (-) comp13134_c1_seq1:113-271(-)
MADGTVSGGIPVLRPPSMAATLAATINTSNKAAIASFEVNNKQFFFVAPFFS